MLATRSHHNHHNHTGSNRLRCSFFLYPCWSNPRGRPVAARDGADGGTGSARRRRERRLRSWLRHEQRRSWLLLPTKVPKTSPPAGERPTPLVEVRPQAARAAHEGRLRAGGRPRHAADGGAVGEGGLSSSRWWWASWRSARPKAQDNVRQRRWSTSRPRRGFCQSGWWSILHPRQQCSNRQRL